ncbi:polysaccharide deacetylase [Candidatus Vecturithrix granuli]|uniref:Polysaccharide deacetylase n=1 Tax=Vecturithrix granuli TaxID=1499967 RepID=A0A081C0V3_VECG1|nr:polysaccharide deacetylase [Candidatus Vecturithrix granuli]
MSYYIPAYDVEAIYPWWELGDQKYSADLYQQSVSYSGQLLQECLDGIAAVAEVHRKKNLPATFFLVGKLVEHAASELRAILDDDLFDLQCHSYTHADVLQVAADEQALKHELQDAKRLIEDTFGREVLGFTTPAGFPDGLAGRQRLLQKFWEAGYRYIRSVGMGPFHTIPAPLTQPFWYAEDGYPDLLELGLHAWHDNVLSGQPFAIHWPPILPWGYPANVPQTAAEMYAAYAPGIEYVAQNNLRTYIPCFHPWAIYRIDQHALHIELLLTHAMQRMSVVSCTQFYELSKNHE